MNITQNNFTKSWLWFFVFVAGLTVYHFCFGVETLSPTNINWILKAKHDWGQHYLGWAFFRNEPWTFPLGEVHNWYYPAGTNVGFTDSIPLVAIILKPFSSLLPEDFQYLGIWMAVSMIVTGVYAVFIFKQFINDAIQLLILSVFIIANPVLIYRGLHPALCSHWLILGGLFCYLSAKDSNSAMPALKHQYVLLLLSAAINPYMWLFSNGFTFFISLRLWWQKNLSLKWFIIYNVVSIASVLLIWWIIGMISFENSTDLAVNNAYGLYGFNLNQLFNASGFSKFFPNLPFVSWHQYEGFMFLGAGIYIIIAISIVAVFIMTMMKVIHPIDWLRRNGVTVFLLFTLASVFSAFAISNVVTFNDKILFKIFFPEFVIKIGDVFRASARFFWITYYLITIGILVLFIHIRLKTYVKSIILVIALSIQFYDLTTLINGRKIFLSPYVPPINYSEWEKVIQGRDNLITYPPFQWESSDYQDFSYLAARGHHGISLGYVARGNYTAAMAFQHSLEEQLGSGIINEHDVYITTGKNLKSFQMALLDGAQLGHLDSYYYIYKGDIPGLQNEVASSRKLDSARNSLLSVRELKSSSGDFKIVGDYLYNITDYRNSARTLQLSGWIVESGNESKVKDSVFFLLKSKSGQYIASCANIKTDLSVQLGSFAANGSGFSTIFSKSSVAPGQYDLYLGIKGADGKLSFQATNRTLTIGESLPMPKRLDVTGLSNEINAAPEVVKDLGKAITISGWAVLREKDATGNVISIVLYQDHDYFLFPTLSAFRADVTSFYNNKYKGDNSGFSVTIDKQSLPKGEYSVGVYIYNNLHDTKAFSGTSYKVIID